MPRKAKAASKRNSQAKAESKTSAGRTRSKNDVILDIVNLGATRMPSRQRVGDMTFPQFIFNVIATQYIGMGKDTSISEYDMLGLFSKSQLEKVQREMQSAIANGQKWYAL